MARQMNAPMPAAPLAQDRPVAGRAGTRANVEPAARADDATETLRLQQRRGEPPADRGAATVRMGVYAIRNTVDGALFIGSAPDIDTRWEQHRAALDRASHHDARLQAAWDRHGATAFEFVVLEPVDDGDALAQAEQRWIDRYGAAELRHVYNSQTRSIRKLRKLLALDETARRLGLRPATLRRWVAQGLVACHQPSPDGPRGGDPGQIGFDPEEVGWARQRMRQLEGHRLAEIVARLHEHREQVRRWLGRGRYLRPRLGRGINEPDRS